MHHILSAFLCLFLFSIAGCSQFSKSQLSQVDASMSVPSTMYNSIVHGDVLNVRFLYHQELTTKAMVPPDGQIILPMLGPVSVVGKTAQQLREELLAAYSKNLVSPDIVVDVDRTHSAVVYVTGEVKEGGSKPLVSNTTVAQIIAASTPNHVEGDVSSTILVRKDSNGPGSKAYLVDANYSTGIGRNIYLMPGDIVVVPRKGIVLLGDFVRQYIRDLIPPQTNISYGFIYDLNPDSN